MHLIGNAKAGISARFLFFINFIIFILILIIVGNRMMEGEISEQKKPEEVPIVKKAPVKKKKKQLIGEVTRISSIDRNRQFRRNVIMIDGQEVAAFNSREDEIFDVEGEIPDGKVKFFDKVTKATGVEYFRDGVRHGSYIEYYKEGMKRREAEFVKGEIRTDKIYYGSGKLRLEADYRDVSRYVDPSKVKEVGEGRVYYHTGIMQYEWNITNALNEGFAKSYNIKGELVELIRYDLNGNKIEVIHPKEQVQAP